MRQSKHNLWVLFLQNNHSHIKTFWMTIYTNYKSELWRGKVKGKAMQGKERQGKDWDLIHCETSAIITLSP